MRAVIILGILFLAACGDEDRGYATTAGAARQEPYTAIPPGSVPVGTGARLQAVAPAGPPVTHGLLRAGALAYRGKCAPCHGLLGRGDGPVVEKGFPRPPGLATATGGPARVVAVVTEGIGEMPSLAEEVPPAERWAIAYYLAAGPQRDQ